MTRFGFCWVVFVIASWADATRKIRDRRKETDQEGIFGFGKKKKEDEDPCKCEGKKFASCEELVMHVMSTKVEEIHWQHCIRTCCLGGPPVFALRKAMKIRNKTARIAQACEWFTLFWIKYCEPYRTCHANSFCYYGLTYKKAKKCNQTATFAMDTWKTPGIQNLLGAGEFELPCDPKKRKRIRRESAPHTGGSSQVGQKPPKGKAKSVKAKRRAEFNALPSVLTEKKAPEARLLTKKEKEKNSPSASFT